MPHAIVFDTNYLRGLGVSDFLLGELPETLYKQVSQAIDREDLVVIPNTVCMEINSYLKKVVEGRWNKLTAAHQRLTDEGYKVEPDFVEKPVDPDIMSVLCAKFPSIFLLKPTLEEYMEAERRTSYRLPPTPKKDPDSEEFRDRLIWCQLLNFAKTSSMPILVVSDDGLFENGAESEEGTAAGITVVKGQVDLDQHLGDRPDHIRIVVNHLMTFAKELDARGISLNDERIERIEELRTTKDSSGALVRQFMLVTADVEDLPQSVSATLVSVGEIPISLDLSWSGGEVNIARQVTFEDMQQVAGERFRQQIEAERAENELREVIRS